MTQAARISQADMDRAVKALGFDKHSGQFAKGDVENG